MTITIKSSIPNYSGTPALTAEVSVLDGTTIINGAGSAVTNGARFSVSFSFNESVVPGIYEVRYVNAGVVFASGTVWVEATSGTFNLNDQARLAVYQQRLAKNIEAVVRDTTDTKAIEFDWEISGATFATSAAVCKRRFPGETSGQVEPLSGAITAISGVAGRYSLAYNVADRAQTGGTVVPTDVTYTLEDDNGNTGDLSLHIIQSAGSVSVTVLPVVAVERERQKANNIPLFVGEQAPTNVAVKSVTGAAVDLTGMTLSLKIETQQKAPVDTIAITASGSSFTFTPTVPVTSVARTLDWALWDTVAKAVVCHGTIQVGYVPIM